VKQFEYGFVSIHGCETVGDELERLNRWGQDGWQVLYTVQGGWFVMREVQKETKTSAQILGRKGGKARAKNLKPKQLSEQARAAVNARWAKYREERGPS
jgi:hypothetical protein